jgi:hypothetical protein
LRVTALLVALIVTAGAATRAFACPRQVSCCPAAPGEEGPELERACCCAEPGERAPVRPPDLVAVRVSVDDEPLPAIPARVTPPLPSGAPHRAPAARHSAIPPPTLLHARTAFLC